MQREFYYVNLNSNESIFLFAEKYTDYHVVVEKMYRFFAHQFDSECYFAVSKEIEDRKNLAEEFKALEKQEEKKADPAEDSEIMEQITNDIQYKDLPHLRQDFQKLEDKYRANKQFSDMYVKFVFSGILKELLDQMDGMDEKMLSKRVDRLYRCKNLYTGTGRRIPFRDYESKKLHLSSLPGEESWSRDAFSNGISFSRIFKCCVQRRNGSDTEPLYP